jgi:hypothetical protein
VTLGDRLDITDRNFKLHRLHGARQLHAMRARGGDIDSYILIIDSPRLRCVAAITHAYVHFWVWLAK